MPQYMTADEWRELERQSEIKHEYIDGQVYAMAGGTLAHSFIISEPEDPCHSGMGMNGESFVGAWALVVPSCMTKPSLSFPV